MITLGVFMGPPARAMEVATKLGRHPDLFVTAVASTFKDAYEATMTTTFDVSVSRAETMEFVAQFRARTTDTLNENAKRVFLTDRITAGQIVQGVHTGFDNYLVSTDDDETWRDTILQTVAGTSSLRIDPLWNVAGDPLDMTSLCIDHLPDLDRDIIELLSEGLTNEQIADVLHVSCQTVRNHVHRMMDRIGVSNRTLLSLTLRRSRVAWRQTNA